MSYEDTLLQDRLQEENRQLKSAVEELSIINDIATAVTSTQPVEQIIELVVQKCVKHLKVEQGAVMLLNEKDQQNPFQTMIRRQDSSSAILRYRLNTQLTGWMLKNKTSLLINNFETDKRFRFINSNTPWMDNSIAIRSLLSVPMMLKGKMIGLITVFNKHTDHSFTGNDEKLLGIIASQSAQIIENARLYHEEQDLIHLREEMRLASEIQIDLLPKTNPVIEEYDIAGRSIPAKEVGGDFFDFIQIDDERLGVCLGDISGKGIPAALLMANLQATIRAQILSGRSCKETVTFSNKMLYHSIAAGKFATLFLAILNNRTHEVAYSNAGHNAPYLISKDLNISYLKSGGIIIGVLPDADYEESIININPGEMLVLISDGITEAMNNNDEEFSDERLTEMLLTHRNLPAETIIQKVFNEIKDFASGRPQVDDITMVVIKRTLSSSA